MGLVKVITVMALEGKAKHKAVLKPRPYECWVN